MAQGPLGMFLLPPPKLLPKFREQCLLWVRDLGLLGTDLVSDGTPPPQEM